MVASIQLTTDDRRLWLAIVEMQTISVGVSLLCTLESDGQAGRISASWLVLMQLSCRCPTSAI